MDYIVRRGILGYGTMGYTANMYNAILQSVTGYNVDNGKMNIRL